MPELRVEELRCVCDPKSIADYLVVQPERVEGIIGQARAVEALRFGLAIQDGGYNIYVAGQPGTGRATAVGAFLRQEASLKPAPADWCYVNNFQDLSRPKALQLPPGGARMLQRDMKQLIANVQREVRRAFESEEYAGRREEIVNRAQRERNQQISRLSERAQQQGFLLQETPVGFLVVPVVQGQPLDDQQFAALDPLVREDLTKRREALFEALQDVLKQLRGLQKETQDQLHQMDHEVVLHAAGGLVDDVIEKYEAHPQVVAYLNEIKADILENFDQLRAEPRELEAQVPPQLQGMVRAQSSLRRFEVNVIVDNSSNTGAPVVMEFNPTYQNLFGRVEKEAQFGTLVTDFTLIRGGSLHRANGGYLVLRIEDVLRNPFSWDGLKRAIRNGEIAIEDISEALGFATTKGLRPECIPLQTKVVLIGDPFLYYLLYSLDIGFNELFKVKADFDSSMPRSEENQKRYAAFVAGLCGKECLSPFDASAAARVIEFGSRLAEDQEKLSTKFAQVADLMREAAFWAKQDGAETVSAAHVDKALEAKIYRSNLIQEKIRELMERDTLKIDTSGEAIGQVNGLSVISLGDFSFGRPSRLTVSLGVGREGLIDIEREAKFGGRIYNKGVLIATGYLMNQYAQDKPLTLSARLVFEQSYEEIEGDSASSTEIYALLSRLSGVPIKQGIAVTGSVNQRGEVQAIGGVNEKIEGFFDLCKVRGLTGDQGVLIPASNVHNLMLKPEVIEAVRAEQFHIWAASTIDEGVEVLTGVPAGVRREDGTFPEGTIHGRADKTLRDIAEKLRRYGEDRGRRDKDKEDKPEENHTDTNPVP